MAKCRIADNSGTNADKTARYLAVELIRVDFSPKVRGRMDSLLFRCIAKSALLCLPAIVILAVWGRRGVSSRQLYAASWLNAAASALWLVALAGRFASAASLFVFWPFVMIVVTIFVSVMPAPSSQRRLLVLANVFMGIWWASLITAPN